MRYLSDDETWKEVETALGRRPIRAYDLRWEAVRSDSTVVAVYHDVEGNTLFRHGHGKDHRPDPAQFKVMLGTLPRWWWQAMKRTMGCTCRPSLA